MSALWPQRKEPLEEMRWPNANRLLAGAEWGSPDKIKGGLR
jgi:hypothetical protein